MTEPWDRTFYLCVGHEWCVCPLCSTYQREGIKVLALYWKKLCANIAPNVYQNVEMNKKSFFLAFLRCFVSKRIHLSLSSSFSHLVRCRLNIFPVSLTVVGCWLLVGAAFVVANDAPVDLPAGHGSGLDNLHSFDFP